MYVARECLGCLYISILKPTYSLPLQKVGNRWVGDQIELHVSMYVCVYIYIYIRCVSVY